MNEVHQNLEPQDFEQPETIRLAKYDSSGNIIKGTEESGNHSRTYGKDYFATDILERTSEYVNNAKNTAYEQKVLKKLRKFEKFYISDIADYYTLQQSYASLKKMISSIADDKVRKAYSTRCTDKYESLQDESVAWKEVVAAYEKQQKEENARLAEEQARKSKEAREEQTHKTRVALARTRLKRLTGKKFQPSNMYDLIDAAQAAVEQCKQYKEYEELYKLYVDYRAQILSLPTKSEYEAGKNRNTAEPSGGTEGQD